MFVLFLGNISVITLVAEINGSSVSANTFITEMIFKLILIVVVGLIDYLYLKRYLKNII